MKKPYSLIVYWQDGRRDVVANSHSPTVLSKASTVARNPRVIRRIELHDLQGCLSSIWDAKWS